MKARFSGELGKLAGLSLPLIIGQLAHSGVSFTDTVTVGRLGSMELAAVALGASVYFFLFIFCSGVLFSVAPSVSQAYGAGEPEGMVLAVRQGVWLALFLALPIVVLLNNAEPFLLFTGQEPGVAAQAAGYLKIISLGFIPMILTVALRGFLEGTGDTRPLMYILIGGLVIKIALNSVLLTGWGPFPALGIRGAAFASACVYVAEFLAAAFYISRRYAELQVLSRLGRPHGRMLGELVRVGVPIGFTVGFESGLFTVAAFLMGRFGAEELAAHQVALASTSMAFNIPLALGLATAVRVGQNVGRNDAPAAALSAGTGIAAALGVMCVTALTFLLFPSRIVGLYLDMGNPLNAGVIAWAVTFLGYSAMFQLADGVQVVAAGALRGYKDTAVPMVISLVSYWFVGLGGGLLLAFPGGMGPDGIWLGLVAGLFVAAILLSLRLRWRTRQPVLRRVVTG